MVLFNCKWIFYSDLIWCVDVGCYEAMTQPPIKKKIFKWTLSMEKEIVVLVAEVPATLRGYLNVVIS